MSFSLCKRSQHFIHIFSKYSKGTCRIFIHRPCSTRNRQTNGGNLFNYKCRLRTSSAQRGLHGIALDGSTSVRRKFVPSTEQQAIVDLCLTQNVVVSARPGAGKTATAEAIIAADPDKPIAVVTYSKRLQLGTAQRLAAYPRSDVFTFHALAGRLFSTTVYNDTILRSLRREKTIPTWTGEPYELIILDEFQDCTDDIFWLVCAFMSAVTHAADGKAPQIVVLGDERQAIYEFKGADARYLSLSSSAMTALSPYPWTHMTLSNSFRLSHENAAFVNNVFLRDKRYISGSHSGPKPIYLYGNLFDVGSVARHLLPLIHEYGPEHTAILAPSVRQNPQLSSLANDMSEYHGIPIAVSISDDIPLDDNVLRGKVCVSTYHQFKGNERDLVIVYGVDDSYFKFLGRDLPDDTCPNTTFVALTRAREQLVMLHDNRNGPMPFIDVAELEETADFIHIQGAGENLQPGSPGRPLQLGLLLPTNAFPSDMPRHIPDEIIDGICTRNIRIDHIQKPLPDREHIDAPAIVLTDNDKKHYEAVSDLNGLAVVAAYEYDLLGTLTTLGSSKKTLLDLSQLLGTGSQAAWLCREACKYEARLSGYKSRNIQMKGHNFAWLGPYLEVARKRLSAQFPTSAMLEFEVKLEEEDFLVANPLGGDDQETFIRGRADIVRYEKALDMQSSASKRRKRKPVVEENMDLDHVSIWEIKFVAQLSLQHAIQSCIYAYLWSKKHARKTPPRIILFNVRDGEKWEIVPLDGVASLRRLVEETLVAKYSTTGKLTTDEFLRKCAKTKVEVENSHRQEQ